MDNILKKSEFYLVTDIMPGILTEGYQQPQLSIPHPIESTDPQASKYTIILISTVFFLKHLICESMYLYSIFTFLQLQPSSSACTNATISTINLNS